MITKSNVKFTDSNVKLIAGIMRLSLFFSKQCITIIRFGFCDVRNNQGLGLWHQPQPSASADNTYLTSRP